MIRRFHIYLISLNPTLDSETAKTRPCIVLSPDEMNRHLQTVIVAPMTRTCKNWPTRHPIHFQGKTGQIALDQLRTVSKQQLIKHLGCLDAPEHPQLLKRLQAMFA